jgi:class 3 adenylate cyclase
VAKRPEGRRDESTVDRTGRKRQRAQDPAPKRPAPKREEEPPNRRGSGQQDVAAISDPLLPSPKLIGSMPAIDAAKLIGSMPHVDAAKLIGSISAIDESRTLASVNALLQAQDFQRTLRNLGAHVAASGSRPRPEEVVRSDPSRAVPQVEALKEHSPPNLPDDSREARRLRRAVTQRLSVELVVMAADIRRSSILMKEAADLHQFALTLGEFVEAARNRVWEQSGWFDKFTGDGFLAYWPYDNQTKAQVVRSVIETTVSLRADFRQLYIPQFAANSQNFPEDVGLAIGLDSGSAKVVGIVNEPTIVGPAVVGAVRMVAEAAAWTVLLNVHLGEYVRGEPNRFPGVDISPISVPTKEYDAQLAYLLLDVENSSGSG